jgi:hypothetical protein
MVLRSQSVAERRRKCFVGDEDRLDLKRQRGEFLAVVETLAARLAQGV